MLIRGRILPLLLTGALLLSGCAADIQETTDYLNTDGSEADETSSADQTIVDTSDMFTGRDMETDYDETESAVITLSGTGASCDSDAVQISGSTVTIIDEGTYILSGTLDDGIIIVNADDADKVRLVLNGVEIVSADSAAIYVLSADKVFITTAAGTDNILSNGGEYVAIDDNNIDAVIFAKSDLTLNGEGTLKIEAAAGHGIVSKDDLVLAGGTYDITAASHGISGKDSVRIAGGTYTIESGKDGIHAENADNADLGFLYIADGTFHITAQGDGISAGSYLLAEDGAYYIETGGGSANAAVKSDGQDFGPMQWRDAADAVNKTGTDREPDMDKEPDMAETAETESTSSAKGFKAGTELMIYGGTFTVDCADDAFHSNGNLTISEGVFEIAAGDDGMHADNALTISGGSIDITQSYEGIEGLSIDITGGDISLVASDDGLNAAGGNDSSGFGGRGEDIFAATEGAYINIAGGTLYVNAFGDGIDSNGDLTVSGGETYVSGPANGANGALDYSGDAVISGGIFVAAGSAGMAQNFGTDSTQGVMMVRVDSGSAGSIITLCDDSGKELVSWQSDKEYSSVVISCPEITEGAAYTLTADSYTTQITMDSLVYGEGMGAGMGGGMRGSGKMQDDGGKPGGDMPEGGEAPAPD